MVLRVTNDSQGLLVEDVSIVRSNDRGLFLNNTNNAILKNIRVNHTQLAGIWLHASNNNRIEDAVVNDAKLSGVYLTGGSKSNALRKLKIKNVKGSAIEIDLAHNNSISNSKLETNRDAGVMLTNAARDNIVNNVVFNQNKYAVRIAYSLMPNKANLFEYNCFLNKSFNIDNEMQYVSHRRSNLFKQNYYAAHDQKKDEFISRFDNEHLTACNIN